MQITIINAVRRLFLTWLYFSLGLIIFIAIISAVGERWGDNSWPVWSWLLFLILPLTSILIMGYIRHQRIGTLQLPRFEIVLYRVFFMALILYQLLIFSKLLLSTGKDISYFEIGRKNIPLFVVEGFVLLIASLFIYRTELFIKANQNLAKNDLLAENNTVFISYNHNDKEIAEELKKRLLKQGIEVIIDSVNMQAGEKIQDFIRDSIKNSRITLSVVSSKSLLSGWVAIESIESFFLEKYSESKKFIACHLDNDFFDLSFTTNSIQKIDEKLENINELIQKQTEMGVDTRDLNDEKTRLMALRNNLDQIIQKLRSSLCIEVTMDNINESFPKLLNAILIKE